jgi:uroporphyrinogen decarboxylase
MTDQQWQLLKQILQGQTVTPLPVGFIIDSPWLPGWYGIKLIDYFSNDDLWLQANLKAVQEYPEVIFLPGFWAEYGMCTEPSAFGARCTFPENEFPFAHKILHSTADIQNLPIPNPKTDGLLPLVINRLKLAQPKIEAAGHKIRFAVARGPLNIAAHLMGTSELLMAMMLEPQKIQRLLEKVTQFLKDWLAYQREVFPTIDGILLLDDIIGFIGKNEFVKFVLPCFQELFAIDVSVKFLHNDAPCKVSAPFLPEMGVNLFNMGYDLSLQELKQLTQNQVVLVGNLPPRDVLAAGTPQLVREKTTALLNDLSDKTRVIFSCGGGMPPGVSTANLNAFIETVRNYPIN